MDGTHVGHLSYVGDSILGEKCNLGAGTIIANLRFDDGHVKMMIKDKVIDTGRRKLGVVMGDNVKTGIKSLLMPGVKLGANSWVGANLMVERDLPANAIAVLKQDYMITQKKIVICLLIFARSHNIFIPVVGNYCFKVDYPQFSTIKKIHYYLWMFKLSSD
jgi:bifunctional N-acetylglucosamine-1-phosphate-uridyltransferase/glucosamine-1-phosphate-acetyltransferase GlmU-like protein